MKKALTLIFTIIICISVFCGFDIKGPYVAVEPLKLPAGEYDEYVIADFDKYFGEWDVGNPGGHGNLDARSTRNECVKVIQDNTLKSKALKIGTLFNCTDECRSLFAVWNMNDDKLYDQCVIPCENLKSTYLCFKIYVHNMGFFPPETTIELSEIVDKREFQLYFKDFDKIVNNVLAQNPDTWIQINMPLNKIPENPDTRIPTPGKNGDNDDFTVGSLRIFMNPSNSSTPSDPAYMMVDDIKILSKKAPSGDSTNKSNSTTYTGSAKSTSKSPEKKITKKVITGSDYSDTAQKYADNTSEEITYNDDDDSFDIEYETEETVKKEKNSNKSNAPKTLIIVTVAICSLAVLAGIGLALYLIISKKAKKPASADNNQ